MKTASDSNQQWHLAQCLLHPSIRNDLDVEIGIFTSLQSSLPALLDFALTQFFLWRWRRLCLVYVYVMSVFLLHLRNGSKVSCKPSAPVKSRIKSIGGVSSYSVAGRSSAAPCGLVSNSIKLFWQNQTMCIITDLWCHGKDAKWHTALTGALCFKWLFSVWGGGSWLYLAATAEGCFTMTLISFRAGTARAHFLKSVWNFNRRPRKAGSRSKLGFKCVCGRMK